MLLRQYNNLLDSLREQRSTTDWKPEDDREKLEELCLLFDELTAEEQEQANEEGWRSWPDLYDQRMEEGLVENPAIELDFFGPVRVLEDTQTG